MKIKLILISFFLLGLIGINDLSAQLTVLSPTIKSSAPKYKYNTWSVSVNYGLMLFYGQIKEYPIYPAADEYRTGFKLAINKQLNTRLAINTNVLIGNLSGTRRELNKYFFAELNEYALNANYTLCSFSCHKGKNLNNKIYITAGIGTVNFRSIQKTIDNHAFIKSYGYSSYGIPYGKMTSELIVPIGIGYKYKIDDNIDIGVETALRFVHSDKLDAEVVKGSQDDKYQFTSISVTYKFGNGRYPLEWVSKKQKENIDAFLNEKVYKKRICHDTILSIYFEPNGTEISLADEVKLVEIVKYMNINEKARLKIIGYYDINSEDRFINNGTLSGSRANAIITLLTTKYLISGKRLVKKKKSDVLDYPLTLEKNNKNRRVDVILIQGPKFNSK